MTAVRMLTRREVQERLDEFGCELVEEDIAEEEYYRLSYWRTSWGFRFFVPEIGPDQLCSKDRLDSIVRELAFEKGRRSAK
jgi:hypothetical protein